MKSLLLLVLCDCSSFFCITVLLTASKTKQKVRIRLAISSANFWSVYLSTVHAVPSKDLEFAVNRTLGLCMIFCTQCAQATGGLTFLQLNILRYNLRTFRQSFVVQSSIERVWHFYTNVKHLEIITPIITIN
jgi:hypothetical protein